MTKNVSLKKFYHLFTFLLHFNVIQTEVEIESEVKSWFYW